MSDGLKFVITGDDAQYRQTLERVRNTTSSLVHDVQGQGKVFAQSTESMAQSVAESGERMSSAFKQAASGAIAFFSIDKAREFVSELINVRAQIESMSTSFEVYLGSQERSTETMRILQSIASSSPLTLQGLGSSLETMLGFNVEGDKAITILRQLGDISAGDSEKLKSLALAFSQASSTGRLMGQDLLQMINAGFNPLVEISRTTGRSMSDLKEDMSNGLISIDMLESAFASATSEGGKFHGMLEKQGQTLKGASAQLSGAIDDMYNKIGQSNQSLIAGGYELATSLVHNYETIGEAIMSLVAVVGVHKAAIIARNAVEVGGQRLRAVVGAQAEAVALEQVASAGVKEILAKQGLTAGTHAYNIALKEELITELEAIKAKLAKERVDSSLILSKEAQTLLTQKATLEQAIETAGVNANTASKSLNAKITTVLSGAVARLNVALASNAWSIALVAITALAYGLYKFITYQTDSQKAQAKLNESLDEGQKSINRERLEVETLFEELKNAKKGTKEWDEARDAIQSKYGSILSNQRAEIKNLEDIATAQSIVTEEVIRNAKVRAKHSAQNTAQDTYIDRASEAEKAILDNLKNDGDYSEEQARSIYNKLKKAFDKGEYSHHNGQVFFNDKDLTQKIEALGAIDYTDVRKAFGKILQAKTDLDSQLADISTLYGDQGGNTSSDTKQIPAPIKTIGDSIAETRANIKKLKQELRDLRSGKLDSRDYARDIEAKEQSIKDAEGRLETLTGVKRKTTEPKDKSKAEQARVRDRANREELRQREDLAYKVRELEVSAEQSTAKRVLAEMNLRHERQMATLKRQKEDYLEAKRDREESLFDKDPRNKGKTFDRSSVSLDETEQGAFAQQQAYISSIQAQERAKLAQQERTAMNEYLREYGTYEEKRLSIAELYALKIANAKSEGERLALHKQAQAETAKLDAEANKTTDAIAKLFGDMRQRTSTDMRVIADEGEQALDYIAKGIYAEDKDGKPLFGITRERLGELSQSTSALKDIRDQIEIIKDKANQSDTALGKIARGLSRILKAKRGTDEARASLDLLSKGFGSLQSSVGIVSNALTALGDATGSSVFGDIASGLGEVMDVANSALEGFKSGGVVGGIIAGVAALAGAISKAVDQAHENRIQALQGKIDNLNKGYDQLGKAIERAFSSDASRLLIQQEQLLRQKQELIRTQIIEEESKKKSDKGRVQSMKQELETINNTIADNRERAVDAIFGQDIKSAISDFATAYAEAWSGGGSSSESLKKQAQAMMKRMLTEQLKALASPDVERIRERLQEFWADKVFTRDEQAVVSRMVDEAQRKLDSYTAQGINSEILSAGQGKGVEPSKRAFEGMSQETANELNGRFTAIQQSVGAISGVMDDLRSLGVRSLGYLEEISKSNKQLYDISDRLRDIERNTRGLK